MKRAGYVAAVPAREIVTAPSSSGSRSVSRTEGENSASSSRNSAPPWASVLECPLTPIGRGEPHQANAVGVFAVVMVTYYLLVG